MVVGPGVVLVGVAETLSDHKGRCQLTIIKGIWFWGGVGKRDGGFWGF
jgi:hypothetical protein